MLSILVLELKRRQRKDVFILYCIVLYTYTYTHIYKRDRLLIYKRLLKKISSSFYQLPFFCLHVEELVSFFFLLFWTKF